MSKIIIQVLIQLIVVTFLSTLAGCSNNVPVISASTNHIPTAAMIDLSSTTLPNVAAEFKTTRQDTHPEHEHGEHAPNPDYVVWRFWRDSKQVNIERPQLAVGELWQLEGHSLMHRKLYHSDRRAIEFQSDDLRVLDTSPSWQKLSLLIDQTVLEHLTASDMQWLDGYPIREYQGKVADSDWHIIMRMDLALPVLIERHFEHGSDRTELVHAYPLNQAPWQPTPMNGYDVIDFADLGDKEYDPFVAKILSQMGHDHPH